MFRFVQLLSNLTADDKWSEPAPQVPDHDGAGVVGGGQLARARHDPHVRAVAESLLRAEYSKEPAIGRANLGPAAQPGGSVTAHAPGVGTRPAHLSSVLHYCSVVRTRSTGGRSGCR